VIFLCERAVDVSHSSKCDLTSVDVLGLLYAGTARAKRTSL